MVDFGSREVVSIFSRHKKSKKFANNKHNVHIQHTTSTHLEQQTTDRKTMPNTLTATQLSNADEIFMHFDHDNSGYIKFIELKHALKKFGVIVTSQQVDTIVSIIDTNHDGKISCVEFKQFIGESLNITKADVMAKMEIGFLTAEINKAAATESQTVHLQEQGRDTWWQVYGISFRGRAAAQEEKNFKWSSGIVLFVLTAFYIYGLTIGINFTNENGHFNGSDKSVCVTGARVIFGLSIFGLALHFLCFAFLYLVEGENSKFAVWMQANRDPLTWKLLLLELVSKIVVAVVIIVFVGCGYYILSSMAEEKAGWYYCDRQVYSCAVAITMLTVIGLISLFILFVRRYTVVTFN